MQKENNKKALILLSGGIDSATCLAYAKANGYQCYAISFDYNQRHKIELNYAKKIAKQFNVKEHIIVKLDMSKWGGSALTNKKIKVPKSGIRSGIPITYVPARNLVFLSIASAYAEAKKINEIFIGVNSLDYSGYPDCRPQFIKAFQKTVNLGTKVGIQDKKIKINTPLQKMTKYQIIKLAFSLGVNIDNTISCYDPSPRGIPCGKCDSCEFRKAALLKIKLSSEIKK
jgi:7-cyano-7-deazaguanine synthase